MINNNYLQKPLHYFLFLNKKTQKERTKTIGFCVILLAILFISPMQAQTPLIDPAQGAFSLGPTFEANGWTVANQGTGSTKWVVGSAVTAKNNGTTQATTATGMPATSFTVTLAAANGNIAVGQEVTGTNIAPNTYVSNISSTTLTLTRATTNSTPISAAVSLTFTAISANITGNSAYVSTDNGLSNNYNYTAARRIYFYRDINLPAAETAYSLTFDVRSNGSAKAAWQVLVAPVSVTPVGSDSQVAANIPPAVPEGLAGALPLTYGSGFLYTQSIFTSIPPSFAGQKVRLIFMWTNDSGTSGNSYPAAIDNIKLTSRVAGDVVSVDSGLFSNPATWDVGVPTAADNAIVQAAHTINLDKRALTVTLLNVNGFVDFGFNSDELTVLSDFKVAGNASRFNNYYTTATGRSLKVAGAIDIVLGGRFDSSVSSSTIFGQGILTLNGSAVQTVTVDNSSFLGGNTLATSTSNAAGVIGQLAFNNTNTATPNINWNVSSTADVRISQFLKFPSGRVALGGTSKFILGNYAPFADNAPTSSFAGLYLTNGQGFLGGTLGRYFGTSASSVLLESGAEYAALPYPFINAKGNSRAAFIVRPSVAGAVAGEVYVTYIDSNEVNIVSIPDSGYTITNQYAGNWTITKDGTYANTAPTDLAFSAMGAYRAIDGSSRISKSATAATGVHINGTSSPFAMRAGVSASDLFAGAFYVGAASTSLQGTPTKRSTGTGDWNTAGTWSPSGAPDCSDVVFIDSGHTVTVNGTASAAGIYIVSGGTLVNASGTLTVGFCSTGNNASFFNEGTYTISGGTMTVKGSIFHKTGSVLNQTGGEIIVDGNNAGEAPTSVGQGASLFRIDNPASVNLAAGKITIVDPLVNSVLLTSATTVTDFPLPTAGTTGTITFTINRDATAPTNSIRIDGSPNNKAIFYIGQVVSAPGIPTGTTITNITTNQIDSNVTFTLSAPITANISNGTLLTISTIANGNSNVYFGAPNNLAVGQIVTTTTGTLPANTTITSISTGTNYYRIGLSNPITGLPDPVTAPVTLTFSGASPNSATLILNAPNSDIKPGQAISGTGIAPGTTVLSVSGVNLAMSAPATAAITAPATVQFYAGNPSAFAFIYNSAKHSIAGMNHTLQFGDGSSTDTGAAITNGFLVNTSFGGGVLSLGKLTVDALNADRYLSSNNILNVQSTMTIAIGSVFKKTIQANISPINYGASYFGGDIVNNGTIITRAGGQPFVLANYSNGAETASAIPQTISGSGVFSDNYDIANVGGGVGGDSVGNFRINNTSTGGVTLNFPNFSVEGQFGMIAGILHTSAAYPLYLGSTGGLNPSVDSASNFSNTCYIDGPVVRIFGAATSSSFGGGNLYPVGKSGTYLPIMVATTGAAGLVFKAEAFTSNAGSASANIANLGTNRWKVERIGTAGTLTDFNVRLGAAAITANHIPVQAPTDEDTYDNILGTSATFAAAGVNQFYPVNNVSTPAAVAGATYTGYFSYATGPNCSGTPAPGNTIASAASVCGGQSVTLSLQNQTTGVGLTYQWQASTDGGTTYSNISGATAATYVAAPVAATYYRSNVTCGANTGTSTAVLVTITATTITGTTPDSICSPASTTATLGATASGGTINWYDSAVGGVSLGTGSSFTTPPISTTTTFYAGTDLITPNSFTKPFSGSTTLNANYSGMVFNTSAKIVLKTVTVYPKQTSSGNNLPITLAVLDAAGNLVGNSYTFLPDANITTTLVAQPLTFTTPITIPAGTGYRLLAINGLSAANGLGRNTQTLPFTQGAVTITNGVDSNVGALNTNYNQFYDWTWDEVCSTARVPVTATVTTVVVNPITGTTSACVGSTTTLASTTTGGVWSSATPSAATVDPSTGVVTGVAAGTSLITYTVTANGCTGTDTVTVTINGLPVVNPITGNTTVDVGTTTTLSSTTPGGVWTSATPSAATIDPSTGVVTGIAPGTSVITYTVTANGCSTAVTTTVTVSALATDQFDWSQLKYYPNPVKEALQISYTNNITAISVYNLLGQELITKSIDANLAKVDMSALPGGTYLVKINVEDIVKTLKVVKQ